MHYNPKPIPYNRSRGVTLLDTVVGSALFLVVFVGIAGAFQLSMNVVTSNKARTDAIALAGERIEYVRSLEYASVGTVQGNPAGAIPQTETVVVNAISYTRNTSIVFVDDPEDDLDEADSNGIVADYKAVKVDVSWQSRTGIRHVVLVTRIGPPSGMETMRLPFGHKIALALNAMSV